MTETAPTVTVYTKPACGQCIGTFNALKKAGVSYTSVDVTANPDAHDYITTELGYRSAPVVVAVNSDGTILDHWTGFRHDRIKALAAPPAAAGGRP